MEAVELVTYDNVRLSANLYLPSLGGEWAPAIVVCHGFASSKERHSAFGELAAAAGFAVLIMDLRGHGQSEGELDGSIFNDVAAAFTYVQKRPEVNPTRVAIRGSSMGGWLAIHTAAHLTDLGAVAAYCPATEMQLMTLVEEVGMAQRGHPSEVAARYGDQLPRVNVNSLAKLLYSRDILKSARRISPRPLLIIHSEGDQVVPVHTSRRIYDEAAEPKTLWLLPGGDHQFAQHDRETNARALNWLRMAWVGRE